MLHCVVVALSTGFTSLHAPLRSPHVHGQSAPRPVLHQRAAAAVGVPAVGDEDAAERRASAMEAQSKEIDPVALARGEMKQGVHHNAAPRWSQACRVRRQKGDPAPAQLFCDNRGAIQASRISLGSGMGPMQRSARRVLRPVMLADDGRVACSMLRSACRLLGIPCSLLWSACRLLGIACAFACAGRRRIASRGVNGQRPASQRAC